MKRLILTLLLTSALFSKTDAHEAELAGHQLLHSKKNAHECLTYDREKNTWNRAKVFFNMGEFIKKYHLASSDNHFSPVQTMGLDKKQKAEKIFSALINLKNYYKEKNDTKNYAYTYLCYAKLLSLGFYPKERQLRECIASTASGSSTASDSSLDYCKKFFIKLIRENISSDSKKDESDKKLTKWQKIYDGHLYLAYVKQFPTTRYKEEYIKNAYYKFEKASGLNTTRTSYLLMAEVILDYGYTPMKCENREEAVELAWEFIKKAHEKTSFHGGSSGQTHQNEDEQNLVEKTARPTYLKDLKKLDDSPVPGAASNSGGLSPSSDLGGDDAMDESPDLPPPPAYQDELIDFDFSALTIPTHLTPFGLPPRVSFLNPVGNPVRTYVLDGKLFHRQNVSGEDFSCFFNSTGLTRDEQYTLLQQNCNNPIVRYMVASELLLLSENPDEIDFEVKHAMKYDLYKLQQESLNQQVQQHLRPQAEIEQERDVVRHELYKRCLSLETFMAYVQNHIGGVKMMSTYVSSEDGTFSGDYTAIDAVALLNNFGVKIYNEHNGRLKLIHSYIPQTATQVSYIYHEGVHFQALVPSIESGNLLMQNGVYDLSEGFRHTLPPQISLSVWPFNAKSFTRLVSPLEPKKEYEIIDIIEKQDGSWVTSSFQVSAQKNASVTKKPAEPSVKKRQSSIVPDDEKLKKLYPKVVSTIILENRNTTTTTKLYRDDLVRKILYLADTTDKNYEKIGNVEDISLSSRRVSEILIANDRRIFSPIKEQNKKLIAQAYLEAFQDVEEEKITITDIHDKIADHLGVKKEGIIKQIRFFIRNYGEDSLDDTDEKLIQKVCELYKEGESVYCLSKKFSLSIHNVCKLLHANAPDRIKYALNFKYNKKLGESEKKDLIIKTFNQQKKQGKSSVYSVFKELKSKGIGHKTVERILKSEGIVSKEIRSKHISTEKIQEIKNSYEEFSKKKYQKKEIYELVAKKTNTSVGQVKDAIKDRTYNSESLKKKEERASALRKAYEALTDEQKLTPMRYLKEKFDFAPSAIKNHLEKLGLYKSEAGFGGGVLNTLAPTYTKERDVKPKRAEKKRKFISGQENQPKRKKD